MAQVALKPQQQSLPIVLTLRPQKRHTIGHIHVQTSVSATTKPLCCRYSQRINHIRCPLEQGENIIIKIVCVPEYGGVSRSSRL
jgi:hypothetical protein